SRHALGENALDLLRAEPALAQHHTAALTALRAQLLRVLAVMTHEPLGRAVIREGDAAVRAHFDGAAARALNERRIAAAIEQQDRLLFSLEPYAQRILERLAQHETRERLGRGRRLRRRLSLGDSHVHHTD